MKKKIEIHCYAMMNSTEGSTLASSGSTVEFYDIAVLEYGDDGEITSLEEDENLATVEQAQSLLAFYATKYGVTTDYIIGD